MLQLLRKSRALFSFSKFESILPQRGKLFEKKWASINRWANQQRNQTNKNSKSYVNCPELKEITAFKNYIRENPVAKMYLQGGLDQIPQVVQVYYVDETGRQCQKPREGVAYDWTWE